MRINYNFLNDKEIIPSWEQHAISYLEGDADSETNALAVTIDYRSGIASCAENFNIVHHFIEYIVQTSNKLTSNEKEIIAKKKDFFNENFTSFCTEFKIGSVHATILNATLITFKFEAEAHINKVFELFFLNNKRFICFPSDQDRIQCECHFKENFTTQNELNVRKLLKKLIDETLEEYCNNSKKRKWFASNPQRLITVSNIQNEIREIFDTKSRLDKDTLHKIAILIIEQRDKVQESHTSGKLGRKKPTTSLLVKKLNEILLFIIQEKLLSKEELKDMIAKVQHNTMELEF